MQLLSSYLAEVPKAKQARFLQEVRTAIISGELEAVEVAERIKLAPAKKGGRPREAADFAILTDPEQVKRWTERTVSRLTTKGRRAAPGAPTVADVEAGAVDVRQLAAQTRERLQKAREKAARNAAKQAQRRKEKATTSSPTSSDQGAQVRE